jgi:hypothetical protein
MKTFKSTVKPKKLTLKIKMIEDPLLSPGTQVKGILNIKKIQNITLLNQDISAMSPKLQKVDSDEKIYPYI